MTRFGALNMIVMSTYVVQLVLGWVRGWCWHVRICSLGRSRRISGRLSPLGAAHPHDNHLLTSPALESMRAPDQPNDKRNTTSSRRGDHNDANTGGTVDATTGATSRRCHVRDENGDDETHLDRGFGHDTTRREEK